MLLMCLEVLREEFCFPVRDWEGVCRKLLSLIKLYHRFWIQKYKSEFKHGFPNPEAVARRCSVKKLLLKISQNSQDNTCTIVSFFDEVEETLAHVFSCVFCEISKNTFFYRTPLVAVCPNRGYLHCAILKALHVFQKKREFKSNGEQFFLQNVPYEIFKIFKMFENNMKFTSGDC